MRTYFSRTDIYENNTIGAIFKHSLLAAISLFINGFGVYLTMQANIGAGPWDVLNLGLSKTFGILYGTASIIVSLSILGIDVLMKEPIGIAMFIDSIVVGKSVDFFNFINAVPKAHSLFSGALMMVIGLIIMCETSLFYMSAALGCGPRDTLLVGLTKRLYRLPIGIVAICLLGSATLVGWILGGPVGIGTLICAFGYGPILQIVFKTVDFDAKRITHQSLTGSCTVLFSK